MQNGQAIGWPRSAREILGWIIRTRDGQAHDGRVGAVEDVYVDDRAWAIRHLVVDARHRLSRRRVLLRPETIAAADPPHRVLHTDLTRRQVSRGPTIDVTRPVSRQHDLELQHYYGFPSYAVSVGANVLAPSILDPSRRAGGDPHLRSVRAITGYHVHGFDGDIGRDTDFLLAEGSWAISHLVVSVGSWWPIRKVLVPVDWIAAVSWGAHAIEVSLPAEAVRLAPEFVAGADVSDEYWERLDRYYGPAPFPSIAGVGGGPRDDAVSRSL